MKEVTHSRMGFFHMSSGSYTHLMMNETRKSLD